MVPAEGEKKRRRRRRKRWSLIQTVVTVVTALTVFPLCLGVKSCSVLWQPAAAAQSHPEEVVLCQLSVAVRAEQKREDERKGEGREERGGRREGKDRG